jgi:hypothetical protein
LSAVALLAQGKTETETAKTVGVHRNTIHKWLTRNPAFQAELERRRKEQWSLATERLRSLTGRAVGVLEKNLGDTDYRVRSAAAIHVLRAVGLYGTNLDPSQPSAAELTEKEFEYRALIKFLLLVIRDNEAAQRTLGEIRPPTLDALPAAKE